MSFTDCPSMSFEMNYIYPDLIISYIISSAAGRPGTVVCIQYHKKKLFLTIADPFADVGQISSSVSQPTLSNTGQGSGHQEPMLFVPQSTAPSSPVSQSASFPVISEAAVTGSSNNGASPPQPPQLNPTTNISNPYSLSGGSRSRPQYAANPQMFPTAPSSSMPPMFAPGQSPSMSAPPTSTPVIQPQTIQSTLPPSVSSQSIMPPSFDQLASTPPPPTTNNNTQQNIYQPLTPHWFYCKVLADNKSLWCPFSYIDSANLENAALSGSFERLNQIGIRMGTGGGFHRYLML